MCTREITAFVNPDGGRPIFGFEGVRRGLAELKLPCSKCPECQKDYFTSWATRGSRELANWESNLFITLTYDDAHLPPDRSLNKKHVQDFIKRTKEKLGSSKENPVRQIYCGEYGTQTLRPHYHVILFNADFSDRYLWRRGDRGEPIFRSPELERLWGQGNAEFGLAQPGSIAYLFKYILKKKTRKEKKKPHTIEFDGTTYTVEHEFLEASRNPGIGACIRGSESLKKGFLTVNGVKKKLPKYYLEWLRKNDPEVFDEISNMKFDFMNSKPKETRLRKAQKENAQKLFTDSKKKL